MNTKLTLLLDKNVIEKAKEYAALQNKSLSRLIESYLKSLIDKEKSGSDDDIGISPFVKSMRTGVQLPSDLNDKKVYRDYLSEKFK